MITLEQVLYVLPLLGLTISLFYYGMILRNANKTQQIALETRQLQLYMHFLRINDGIIVVECKDDQRLKEFDIKRKPRVAWEQIRYFSKLKSQFVKAGVMEK